MHELQPGLWHWQSPHPEWSPDSHWPEHVSSYAIDDGERLLLFDPLGVPDELLQLAAGRRPAVVLTAPWHERDAKELVESLGAPLYSPRPESAQDLMDKYGITAEQAGDGSPDLAWARSGEYDWRPFAAGDRLPVGIEAFPGRDASDLVLWIEVRRAVVAGDTLVDFGSGFRMPDEWLRESVTHESVAAGLRPLLDLPVELVLPTHGKPVGRDELERALA